jgi:hypothetical protein
MVGRQTGLAVAPPKSAKVKATAMLITGSNSRNDSSRNMFQAVHFSLFCLVTRIPFGCVHGSQFVRQ